MLGIQKGWIASTHMNEEIPPKRRLELPYASDLCCVNKTPQDFPRHLDVTMDGFKFISETLVPYILNSQTHIFDTSSYLAQLLTSLSLCPIHCEVLVCDFRYSVHFIATNGSVLDIYHLQCT